MKVLYEDNHIIIVSKDAGEIVQGDKTGDKTLCEEVKEYLKTKYNKPGEVFLGVTHRLDRPVSGICVFAKTSKALTRLNNMFREGNVKKTYHAIVMKAPQPEKAELKHYILRNEKQNKSYAYTKEPQVRGKQKAKLAILDYVTLQHSERYTLVEVNLHTGRHHQIRCQLAAIGSCIKGDLKYGAPRSNPDASICLHAQHIEFVHPVSKLLISITAPYPELKIWHVFNHKEELEA